MKEVQKNDHWKMKVLTGIISIASLSLFFPSIIRAEGMSLKVSPTRFQIKAIPPVDIRAPFTIENQSELPVSFKIGYKLFNTHDSQDGTIVFLKKNDTLPVQEQKIFQQMQVVDSDNISHDSIELGPKQKKRLQLRIILPKEHLPTDYTFSLVFLENPGQIDQKASNRSIENQTSTTTLQTGIGLNVLLSIGPKTAPNGGIDTFTTSWLRQTGPIPFTLKVNNIGLHYMTPHGTILINNMFGQTVGKIIIPNTVILAGTGRTFTSTNSPSYANVSSDTTTNAPQIIWPEKFLFGLYSADLSLSLSDEGPVYIRTLHFAVFPLSILAKVFAIVLIVFFVYLRVKKKIS